MQDQSRYPGTRAFQEKERHLFFGRDRDKKKLSNLIVLEKLVVLFGKAGYGKSSLLNAGIIPHLRHVKHHLPIKIRLTPAEIKTKEPAAKPLEILSDQLDLQIEIINKDLEKKNREPCFLAAKMDIPKLLPEDLTAILWYKLKVIQLTKEINEATTLIFDQFEALFRYYNDTEAEEFGRSMAALLHSNPPDEILDLIRQHLNSFTDEELELLYEPLNLKLVFSVASDHLSLLNKLKESLPEIFKYTYEIKALNRVQAQKALEEPAQKEEKFDSPKFTYSDEAIDKIFDYLIKVKNKEGIELENQDIETFQLQLIGQYAEEKIIAKKNKSEFKSKISGRFKKGNEKPEVGIYELSLKDLGEPSNILKKFYKKVIFGLAPFKRYGAQKLVEKGLIIGGNRVPMSESRIDRDYNVAGETLGKLEDRHLLRSEFKIKDGTGTKSYEISHYNLVKPIEESVRRRKIRRLWWLVFLLLAFIMGLIGYIAFSDSDSGGPGEDREVSNGLIINPIGIANVTPPEGEAPQEVEFTFEEYKPKDTTGQIKVLWHKWDFGDNLYKPDTLLITNKHSILKYKYVNPKKYTARLTVMGSDSIERTEEVEIIVTDPDRIIPPKPLNVGVRITADPPSGKVGEIVRFSASPIPDTLSLKSYLWEFMDGQTSTEVTPVHRFNAKGNYNVRLKVLDNLDKIYRNSLAIQVESPPPDSVNQAPLARIRASPLPGKTGQAISFDSRRSSDDKAITKYLWEFDDGAISDNENPSHSYDSIGNYIVRLTVWDAEGKWDNDSINIKILGNRVPLPMARIKASDTVGIAPFEVSFEVANIDSDGSEYEWKFPDGSISNEVSPLKVFDFVNIHEVQVKVTDVSGSETTGSIKIRVVPPVVAVATANPQIGEGSIEVQFDGTKSTPIDSISEYLWEFNEDSTSTLSQPIYKFETAGSYEVSLTVMDQYGNKDSATITIKVDSISPSNKPPVAMASYDPTCSCSSEVAILGSEVIFTSNGSKGEGVLSYLWEFEDDSTSANMAEAVHTFSKKGIYNVRLTVADSLGGKGIDTVAIEVVSPPNPKSEYNKWMARLESLKAEKVKTDNQGNRKVKPFRVKLDRESEKGLNRDSVYVVGIGINKIEDKKYDGLIILLDNDKVYKFWSPRVPAFPLTSKSVSLLKPQRYKYKNPNISRNMDQYKEGGFLEGTSFINFDGTCTNIENSIYEKFFGLVNVEEEKKNQFYYIALEESDFDFDAEAIEEIDCTFELLKP